MICLKNLNIDEIIDNTTTSITNLEIEGSGEEVKKKHFIPSNEQLEARIDGSLEIFENVMDTEDNSDTLTCGQRAQNIGLDDVTTEPSKRKQLSDDENKTETGEENRMVKGRFDIDSDNG